MASLARGHDVRKAETKIADRENEPLRNSTQLDQRLHWDIDHKFPASRLRTIDAELADLGHPPDPSQVPERVPAPPGSQS